MFKRIKNIQSMFSDNGGMKLEINSRREFGKFSSTWNLNNTLLNNEWVQEEITRKTRKYSEMNENKNTTCQNL